MDSSIGAPWEHSFRHQSLEMLSWALNTDVILFPPTPKESPNETKLESARAREDCKIIFAHKRVHPALCHFLHQYKSSD